MNRFRFRFRSLGSDNSYWNDLLLFLNRFKINSIHQRLSGFILKSRLSHRCSYRSQRVSEQGSVSAQNSLFSRQKVCCWVLFQGVKVAKVGHGNFHPRLMGNSGSKSNTVDHGQTKPFGKLYPITDDYDPDRLAQFIIQRRLCPFYPGQEDSNGIFAKEVTGIRKSLTKSASTHSINAEIQELHEDPVECPICFLVIIFNPVLPKKYQLY